MRRGIPLEQANPSNRTRAVIPRDRPRFGFAFPEVFSRVRRVWLRGGLHRRNLVVATNKQKDVFL